METVIPKRNYTHEEYIQHQRELQKKISYRNYSLNENTTIIIYRNDRPYMITGNDADEKSFFIDKNMNILVRESQKEFFPSSCTTIPDFLFIQNGLFFNIKNQFIVINQEKFFNSKGENFVVSYKQDMDYKTILKIKKYYKRFFEFVGITIERLKSIISSVYDENHYDIVLTDNQYNELDFMIIVKHDEITITNSIEQSKEIGTLFTYLPGSIDKKGKILFTGIMKGTRPRYSYTDVISAYAHSHLPGSSLSEFSRFCLGYDNDIFAGIKSNLVAYHDKHMYEANDLEIEGLMLAIQDYLKWESLEGGPHRKIESVNIYGVKPILFSINNHTLLSEDYLTRSKREYILDVLLQKENLELLKPCFNLIKRNIYYRFVCNFPLFVEKSVNIINKNKAVRESLVEYSYDSLLRTFFPFKMQSLQSIESKIDETTSHLIPSYINGQIIPAEVVKDQREEEMMNSILKSCHPSEYIKIANALTRLLNKELKKNEYKNR